MSLSREKPSVNLRDGLAIPNIWNCRARVEVKVILLATGEIIAADAVHAAGNESTEELASKASLNNAGALSTHE